MPTLTLQRTNPREIFPPSHRRWIEQQADEIQNLQRRFTVWLDFLADFSGLVTRHVFENPNMTDSDLRQHRAGLYNLLYLGEELALDFGEASKKGLIDAMEFANFLGLIEKNLKRLSEELHAWHGKLENQGDIPESFIQGIKDIDEGRVVDLDKALNEVPGV